MDKILLAVFIILLLVAVGEFFYLFKLYPSRKNSATKIDNSRVDIKVLTPTINEQVKIPLLKDHQVETLQSLARMKEDVIESSTVKNVFSGKIKTIYTTNKEIQDEFYLRKQYDYALKIEGKNGGINTFFYTNKELKNVKVFETINEKKKEIDLVNLKVSDEILIEQELNLLKEGSDANSLLVASSIIKVNK